MKNAEIPAFPEGYVMMLQQFQREKLQLEKQQATSGAVKKVTVPGVTN